MKLRRTQLFCGGAVGILAALLVWFGFELRHARRMALATSAQGRLNQLHLALHNYHADHGQFPPAIIVDENGRRMHSWRILILPYVDSKALYDAYDFNEPWDGLSNSRLANQMPVAFHSPTEPPSTTHTNMVVITGPGTAFPGSTSTRLANFQDGLENTILLTEIGNSRIPWLAPLDLPVDEMSFLANDPHKPSISSVAWRQPYLVFADRITTYAISRSIPPDALKALTTIAGREAVTRDGLLTKGHLRRSVLLAEPSP